MPSWLDHPGKAGSAAAVRGGHDLDRRRFGKGFEISGTRAAAVRRTLSDAQLVGVSKAAPELSGNDVAAQHGALDNAAASGGAAHAQVDFAGTTAGGSEFFQTGRKLTHPIMPDNNSNTGRTAARRRTGAQNPWSNSTAFCSGARNCTASCSSAFLSRGHVLLEGLPGLGKTALVKTIGQILKLDFKRIQFTPDLMPGDVLGTHILQETSSGKRELIFQPGPVFTNILLADEINRASPKTQSAMLETMQENSRNAARHDARLAAAVFRSGQPESD